MSVPVQLRPIPLWHEHWNELALRKKCGEDQRTFDRGFRLIAYSDDDLTFPHFKQCRVPGLVLGDLQRNEQWPCFMGVDLSGKKRPGNALVAVRVDPVSRRRYPIDIRFLARSGPEVCEAINDMDQRYRPVVIMVENNGYQDSLIDWIGDQKSRFPFWVKVEPTTTTSGRKGDATMGLPGLEVEFKNGAWCFPHSEYEGAFPDDDPPRGWWARLDNEFTAHPIGANTDGVMACWFARQGIETFGGLSVSDEGDGLGDVNRR